MKDFRIEIDVHTKTQNLGMEFVHKKPKRLIELSRGGVTIKVVPVEGHIFGDNGDGTECLVKWQGKSIPAVYMDKGTYGTVHEREDAGVSLTPIAPTVESGPKIPRRARASKRHTKRSRRDSK